MTAKALSIKQPWLWAITDLDKRVENRSRPTSFRGPVWLHASKVLDSSKARDHFLSLLHGDERGRAATTTMPLGAIVCRAEIEDCVPLTRRDVVSIAVDGIAQRRWIAGPHLYVLRNVVKLPAPVPCKGMLGFWTVPADVLVDCEEMLEMAKKKEGAKSPDGGAGRTTDPEPEKSAASIKLPKDRAAAIWSTLDSIALLGPRMAGAKADLDVAAAAHAEAKARCQKISKVRAELFERLLAIKSGEFQGELFDLVDPKTGEILGE